jgi:hypothetical protein
VTERKEGNPESGLIDFCLFRSEMFVLIKKKDNKLPITHVRVAPSRQPSIKNDLNVIIINDESHNSSGHRTTEPTV